MKKFILSLLWIAGAATAVFAQKRSTVILRPQKLNSCCEATPYQLTQCAQALLQSFKNLTAGTGIRICNPSLNYQSVSFAMPHNCYSLQDAVAGVVTFTAFHVPNETEFRVIWGSVPGNFTYYGECPPEPIIFQHPGITQNHVFAAKLIRQSDYQTFSGTAKDYNTMASVAAVKASAIEKIVAVYMEKKEDTSAKQKPLFITAGFLQKVSL